MLGMFLRVLSNAATKVHAEVENERRQSPRYEEEQKRQLREAADRNGTGQAARELMGIGGKVENKDSELSRLLEQGRKNHNL